MQQRSVEDRIAQQREKPTAGYDTVADYLERSRTLKTQYETGIPAEQRELIQISTSNRTADGKNIEIHLQNPFQEIAKARIPMNSDPNRDRTRTFTDRFYQNLISSIYLYSP